MIIIVIYSLRDNNNLYKIIFDNNRDGMFNWKLFSDKKKVVLSKIYSLNLK